MVQRRLRFWMVMAALAVAGLAARAEVCTTQSQMAVADRDALTLAASGLVAKIQAGDAAAMRPLVVADIAKDFSGVSDAVGGVTGKLKGGTPTVEQVYLLDATTLKPGANGAAGDAQFFCTLNKSTAEADFLIPALPAGKYGFAMVTVKGGAAAWRLSFLLRQDAGRWLMAGFYPKPMTAAGHDGIWYWTQARQFVAQKENWNAWLYYQQAADLLVPAGFVQSSNLEKLRSEETAAAPHEVSEGVTEAAPLVVKGADGVEYHLTSMGVDDSLGDSAVDIAVHVKAETGGDPAAARKGNVAAMSALLAAHPELRKPFHGVWVFADVAGGGTIATEQAIKDVP